MSTTSRTIPATAGMGQLVVIFAALLAGTALIVALAYAQLTASQATLAPAAAPAPAVHDHGWSSSATLTTPDTYYRGWYSTAPAMRGNAFDKAHAPGASSPVEERGFGSNRVRFAQ